MQQAPLLILLTASILGTAHGDDPQVKKEMENSKVIPDALDAAPPNVLAVTFKSGSTAELGNLLTMDQVNDPPTVDCMTNKNLFYTVIMTDLDQPNKTSLHHWIIGNIPGAGYRKLDLTEGETFVGYISPSPGLNETHRYVIFILPQTGKQQFPEPTGKDGFRSGLSIREMIVNYNLQSPIAGNFFNVKNIPPPPTTTSANVRVLLQKASCAVPVFQSIRSTCRNYSLLIIFVKLKLINYC